MVFCIISLSDLASNVCYLKDSTKVEPRKRLWNIIAGFKSCYTLKGIKIEVPYFLSSSGCKSVQWDQERLKQKRSYKALFVPQFDIKRIAIKKSPQRTVRKRSIYIGIFLKG